LGTIFVISLHLTCFLHLFIKHGWKLENKFGDVGDIADIKNVCNDHQPKEKVRMHDQEKKEHH